MAEAASVFSSVVPSLRGWSGKLASGLRKEKTQNVDVDVTPKVDAKALNKAETEVRAMAARVEKARKAEEDAAGRVRIAEAALEDVRKRGNATAGQTVAAEERLAKASRDSKVQRDGLLKSENALAAARAKVAAIKSEGERELKLDVDADDSKARRVITVFRAFASRDLKMGVDVDTGPAIVRIAALSRALGTVTLPAAALAVTPYLLSLGASAVQAAGGVALLPAVIGAGAVALGVLKLGLSGVGDTLKYAFDPEKAEQFNKALAKLAPSAQASVLAIRGLGGAWKAMQLDVQGRLFDGLAAKITQTGQNYIPILRGAFSGLAGDLNGYVKDAFDSLNESGNTEGIRVGLGFVREGLSALFSTLAPLTQAFVTLFVAGAPYVAQFGQWIAGLVRQFTLFLGEASRAGLITVWIDNAIVVFRQLGGIAVNVGSILGSLFDGGAASGESFLGILVRVTGGLANALKTPEGAGALSFILTSIRDLVGLVWDKVVVLWPAIQSLAGAFLDLLGAAAPITSILADVLAPVLNVIGIGLQVLAPILGPLIGLWALWNAALFLTNVILSANPLMLIVIAIAALVGAVVYAYQNFEWFRNIVQGAWLGIQVAAGFAWSVLQVIFSALWTAVQAVGGFFVWLWQSVIVPAWNAITAVISWAWTTIIMPVLTAIGTALAYLGLAIVVIFVTPFYLAWQGISAVAQWAWTTILQPIFNFIGLGLTVLGAAFTWLWQAVIVPVWNGITAAIGAAWAWVRDTIFNPLMAFIRGQLAATWNFLWNGVIVPVWNGIMAAIGAAWAWIQGNIFNPIMAFIRGPLNETWQWLWHNVIEPVWNGIKIAISTAWDFIKGVFETGKAAVQAVGQAFSNVADWVARTWATIREAARGPIQFVVDIVYNNGIRPVWNGIAGLFGMAQLGPVTMARGGVLPGYAPGKDTVPAVLSRGEGVLVPEAVRGLGGPAFVGWANRTFSGGRSDGGQGTPGGKGFSRGGVAHFAEGGIAQDIFGAIEGAAGFFMKAFTDPAGAVKDLFAGITGDNARVPGAGQPWTEGPKQIVPKTIEAVIAKVKKWIEEAMAYGGGGNWMPVILQALALTGQSPSMAGRVAAQIQIESGGNPRAINLWDSNAKKGTPSKGLIQTIDPTFQAYRMPGLPNDPYHPLSNIVAGIRYTIARYGSLTHWPVRGGYDQGGIAAGQGIMMKQTIAPERVLSPRQTAAFEALVPLLAGVRSGQGATGYGASDFTRGGGGALIEKVENHYHGDAAGMDIDDLTHALRVVKRGGRP